MIHQTYSSNEDNDNKDNVNDDRGEQIVRYSNIIQIVEDEYYSYLDDNWWFSQTEYYSYWYSLGTFSEYYLYSAEEEKNKTRTRNVDQKSTIM